MIEKLDTLASALIDVDNPDYELSTAVKLFNVRIGLVLNFAACALSLFKGRMREPLLIYQWRAA